VSPTGIEDLQTRAAIERFQQRRGLKVDGRISEPFLRELTKVTGRTFE
jgi:peptidoglycan hydrolase-like protein with peptidoglycan-binding domain